MKRRLTIARSLVNDPDLLLLDEPTTGLDPQARHVVWDRLFRLKQRGKTFVVTTHYMDEAEQLCDRLVVMDHGRIVAEGSPWQLIERYSTREVVEIRFDDERPQNGALAGVADRVEELADRVLLYTRDGDATAAAVADARPAAALDADPPRHARGRLPAPDRPDARRLRQRVDSVLQPLRAYEHWLAQYRRVWRGTIGTSLVNPILYLTALGIGLGTLVDQTQNAPAASRTSTSSRPGLLAAAAMQTAADRVELARDGGDQVVAHLPRDDRDAAHRARCLRRAPALRRHAGAHLVGALYLAVIAAFGAVTSWLALLVVPLGGAARHRLLDADGRARRAGRETTRVPDDLPLPDRPDVPLLGHVLPRRRAAARVRARSRT